MKLDIRSEAQLKQWLAFPQPAVFQKDDLRPHSSAMEAAPIQGCAFLGCEMTPALATIASVATGRGLPDAFIVHGY